MVAGMKLLHDMKICHRDIKCANVFLNSEGEAKLGDFNVSKVMKSKFLSTQTGTPYYASPEVWKDRPYDSKSDIWSLGCVIYEMCALKPPFRASDMNGLYRRVTTGDYSPIPNRYSSELQQVIKNMLKLEPRQRPTAGEILRMQSVTEKS